MTESLQCQEDISSLSVEELLGLLNSPHIEIVEEVRSLVKGQFSTVSDRWLVQGLLDYFFATNSKRILDLLIAAPEPHDKYLLEKVADGIKGGDRFRHISLLLYAVSRSPPPAWIHKPMIHNVITNILVILSPKRESDISVLVSGVMVIVVLLTSIPLPIYKHLLKIFECFWGLVHLNPSREQDSALKPHLQVAVYSLFHRLYALYPCNLLTFLRSNMVGQARKASFLSTLRPMIERVRLHPLLISETKETECSKSRWIGLEPSDLIHECAKLCLDPLQDICEETFNYSSPVEHSSVQCAADSGSFILCSSETSFWSPGVVQSPSSAITSVPHTPIYRGTGIADSPPETAIEATPETTPFTSPLPLINPSPHKFEMKPGNSGTFTSKPCAKVNLSVALDKCQEIKSALLPLSPTAKERSSLKFGNKENHDTSANTDKPHLIINKLKQIQLERDENKRGDTSQEWEVQSTQLHEEMKSEILRKRKTAVFDQSRLENSEIHKLQDLFSGNDTEKYEADDTVDLSTNEADALKDDSIDDPEICDLNSEGLGVPNRKSITELLKTVNTKRLRFLSQCGPPPNIAFSATDLKSRSPTKTDKSLHLSFTHRSRSFPLLSCESHSTMLPKRETTYSSLSLSPIRPPVETFEVATQTEEVPIVNPYEQLLEVLVPSQMEGRENIKNKPLGWDSPYHVLDQYLEFGRTGEPSPNVELGWNNVKYCSNDLDKSFIRSLHSLIVLERYKREIHAERNRRLLSKIKRLHCLQEKDKGLLQEKSGLLNEISEIRRNVVQLQDQNSSYDKLMDEMVEKRHLVELRLQEEKTSQQREHLRRLCTSLKDENKSLTEELDSCRSSIHEMRKKLALYSQQGSENESLRKQVIDLNKKIIIMGEIQSEMKTQMKSIKLSQRKRRSTQITQQMNSLLHKVEQLEIKNRNDGTSLEATMLHIRQLEAKMKDKEEIARNHNKEIETVSAMWQERCDALEKRNKELNSIISTVESQMHQLLRFRPEREGEAGDETRRFVPPTGQEGFPPPFNPEQFAANLPVESDNSFVARSTDIRFKPLSISSVNED